MINIRGREVSRIEGLSDAAQRRVDRARSRQSVSILTDQNEQTTSGSTGPMPWMLKATL